MEPSAAEDSTARRIVQLEQDVLHKNDGLAAENRRFFASRGILAVNFVSSPGAGKTTLLERMIRERSGVRTIHVIQGDQATEADADRIRAAGASALQINTGTGCHLDAGMVARALAALDPPRHSLVAIENVGNLVCPALFDLGESVRVVLLSLPEGADKPLKYPYMFRSASLALLNKADLAPYVEFDENLFAHGLRQVNPRISCIRTSAKTGDGMLEFYEWLESLSTAPRDARDVLDHPR